VLGAVLMVVVMVLVVPVAIMLGGAIWSALFGWFSSDDADRRQQIDAA
jgi:membrane glycosyltransferase